VSGGVFSLLEALSGMTPIAASRGLSAARWNLENQRGALVCGPLEGEAQAGPLSFGFAVTRWNGRAVDRIGVLNSSGPADRAVALVLTEAYVRGDDLVFQYEKLPPHNVAPLIYWRASCDESRQAARIEMIVSVQTDLLHSVPQFPIASSVVDAELWHCAELAPDKFQRIEQRASIAPLTRDQSPTHLFVFRSAKLGLTYAEMVHPSDFVWAQPVVATGESISVTSSLFPEHLEKGVIRRGRICGWFLPCENDLAVAVELARLFINEPLPLTT
jgi:hypothetical protein